VDHVTTIGERLMKQETLALVAANLQCDMCKWLESGYELAHGIGQIEAYGTEILIHRRMFHISSADNPN
jgi:hypothetical protein